MHAGGIFLTVIYLIFISHSSAVHCVSSSGKCKIENCSESDPLWLLCTPDFQSQDLCQGGNGSVWTTLRIQSDIMENLSSATFDFLTIRTGPGPSGLFFRGHTQFQDIGSAGTKHEQRKNPLTFYIDHYEKPINQTYYSFTLHFDLRDARTEDERQFYVAIEYQDQVYEAKLAWFRVYKNCSALPDEAEGSGQNTNEIFDILKEMNETLRQLLHNREEDTAVKNKSELLFRAIINDFQINFTEQLNKTYTKLISTLVQSMRDIITDDSTCTCNRNMIIVIIIVGILNFFSTPFWQFVIWRSSRRNQNQTQTSQTQDQYSDKPPNNQEKLTVGVSGTEETRN